MNSQEITEKLFNLFHAHNGYTVKLNGQIRAKDKKIKKSYSRIFKKLTIDHYNNHYKTGIGLTPSPVVDKDLCYFGAIDIDTYDLNFEKQKEIIKVAERYSLIPEYSTSKGLHLWALVKGDHPVLCSQMRGYLYAVVPHLKLQQTPEVFPKQDELNGEEIGNGITIPYWNAFNKVEDSTPIISLNNEKIVMLPPESAFHKCEQRAIPQSEFKKYDTKHLKEDPFIETKEDFTEGSMQDPEIQKLTGSEILKKVVKEKMSLNDDSFFDDLITLYIGKGVGAFKTDEDILTPIEERLDPDITGAELDYYRAKLDRARIKLEIEDPKQARNKILQNIFFLKKDSKFYDNNFKDVYDKEAINFTYARYFTTKETCTGWVRKNPKRIAVEGWVCRPKDYTKETPIINQGKKQYINSYVPNDLVAEEGNTKPWHDLLDHIFNEQIKYKEYFLDWIAYQIQNPGVKIRHALIIVSTNFQFGKGTLWKFIEKLFGQHNTLAIDVGQALDKSKSYLTNTQIVLIDEMESSGTFDEKKKLLNSLKRIITEDVSSTRSLYVDYKVVETCTNYILFSNIKGALALPKGEVRYWVYITDRPRKNDEFYKAIYQYIEDGGASYVLKELLERDLTDFNPKAIAPKTAHLDSMSEAGEHPITQMIRQMYEEEQFPFTPDREVIASMDLFNWLKKNQKLGRGRINDVSNALEQIGGKNLGQIPVVCAGVKSRPTLYNIRNQEKYEGYQSHQWAELYVPLHAEDGS